MAVAKFPDSPFHEFPKYMKYFVLSLLLDKIKNEWKEEELYIFKVDD